MMKSLRRFSIWLLLDPVTWLSPFMVISPFTLKVDATLKFRIPVPFKVRVLQVAPAVTVTVVPVEMITSSPAPGNEAAPHVAGAFQAPVVTDVKVAAMVDEHTMHPSKASKKLILI